MALGRQIWWNVRYDSESQEANYYFAIINDKREINNIKPKIIEKYSPVEMLHEYLSEKSYDGLFVKILAFNAFNKEITINDLLDVYKGKIKKMPRLHEREKIGFDGLDSYVESEVERLALK